MDYRLRDYYLAKIDYFSHHMRIKYFKLEQTKLEQYE